jgi:hypothetical protein
MVFEKSPERPQNWKSMNLLASVIYLMTCAPAGHFA